MFRGKSHVFALLFILAFAFTSIASAQTTAFSYQGKLNDASVPASGTYAMTFALFDSENGGAQVGSTILFDGNPSHLPAVQVTNGIFSVQLDFGATPFTTGGTRYLEIAVKKSTDVSYTTLTPRQRVNSAPYALTSVKAMVADLASDSLKLGGVNASDYMTLSGGTITGGLTVNGAVAFGSTAQFSGNVLFDSNVAVSGQSIFVGTVNMASNANVNGALAVSGDVTTTGKFNGDGSSLTNVTSTGSKWTVTGASTQAVSNRGYVSDGGSEVTITLPSAPTAGDTVRVMGNLKDTGWKIAQNSGQTVVTNGADFNYKFEARGDSRNWSSITSSADGMKLAAVVRGGKIYTSTDAGLTWTERMGDADRTWKSIASSADGNTLFAAPASGYGYTSRNGGATWTQSTLNTSWLSVAISTDGSLIYGVDGYGLLYSSDYGATWGVYPVPAPSRPAEALAISANGSNIVVGGNYSYIGVSGDGGYNFDIRDYRRSWTGFASSADGARLAAVANGDRIYTSTNTGVGWAARDSVRSWSAVATSSDGTKTVATVIGGKIYSSVNYDNFIPLESDRNWSSIAISADGTRVAAAVDGGRIYVSVPGTTVGAGGYLKGTAQASIELTYLGNGKWIVVDQSGPVTYY